MTAIAAAGIVVIASLVYWQSDKSEPPAIPPQTTPTPISTPSPAAAKLLKLLLTVDNTNGQPLADSNFALFNLGTTKIPATVTLENARILQTDKFGKAESKLADVQEGVYLWKASRPGYRSLTGEFTIREDPKRPGTAGVFVTLESK